MSDETPAGSSYPAVEGRRVSSRLFTIGHGTLAADELIDLLKRAGVDAVVDVRTAPGSRRNPQFSRGVLEQSMPTAGISYRWERDLGGFRRTVPDSANQGLRNLSFRGYADYMATAEFGRALEQLVEQAVRMAVASMCAETLWWRCHRRLIADAVTLLHATQVYHLDHKGGLSEHRLTEGVRLEGRRLVYDGSQGRLDPDRPTP
jgi:uncharacterized protein (DUF488 family)